MKYVYYDPADMQVMAEFNTPNLSVQANWAAKGYLPAVVPTGLAVTRDHAIIELDQDQMIVKVIPSVNPIQPLPSAVDITKAEAKAKGLAKLQVLGLTEDELEAMGLR